MSEESIKTPISTEHVLAMVVLQYGNPALTIEKDNVEASFQLTGKKLFFDMNPNNGDVIIRLDDSDD